MNFSQLESQSLPCDLFNSSGEVVKVTQFNSQGMLVVNANGEDGILPISALSSLSLSDPTSVTEYTVYLNVYPNKVGSRTFPTAAAAADKAGSTCIGQFPVSFTSTDLSA